MAHMIHGSHEPEAKCPDEITRSAQNSQSSGGFWRLMMIHSIARCETLCSSPRELKGASVLSNPLAHHLLSIPNPPEHAVSAAKRPVSTVHSLWTDCKVSVLIVLDTKSLTRRLERPAVFHSEMMNEVGNVRYRFRGLDSWTASMRPSPVERHHVPPPVS